MKSKGIAFDRAWDIGLQRVRWPHDKQSRYEWKAALAETRNVWQDCYHDEGTALDIEALIQFLARPR